MPLSPSPSPSPSPPFASFATLLYLFPNATFPFFPLIFHFSFLPHFFFLLPRSSRAKSGAGSPHDPSLTSTGRTDNPPLPLPPTRTPRSESSNDASKRMEGEARVTLQIRLICRNRKFFLFVLNSFFLLFSFLPCSNSRPSHHREWGGEEGGEREKENDRSNIGYVSFVSSFALMLVCKRNYTV